MRKVLFFIILVIVLVSLNWFHNVFADDAIPAGVNLGDIQLSDAQKEALLKRSAGTSPVQNRPYTTPRLYDSSSAPRLPQPVDTTADSTLTATARELVPFEDLKPFGIELFAAPHESTPPEDIASSSDYLVGPGDNIVVSLWGRVENEFTLTVDREGKVFIPKVGQIVVWGKTLDQCRTAFQQRFSAVYSEFQLNVSLGKIRSIRLYLTGEVRRPGAYSVSSLTSLFNALYLAGGPTENGSMRDIRLMRRGTAITTVDLYKFLLEGDNSSDVRLESGDAIFVPVAGARVAIRGQIRRPAIYELKQNETAGELLLLAGRPTPEAYLGRVMLERVSDRDQWEVVDLNLEPASTDAGSCQPMKDGDRMTVFSIFQANQNRVAIFGMVKHPGYYERTDTTRIADILARGQLQEYDVFYQRANLFRRHSDWRTEVISVDLRAVLNGDSTQNLILQRRDSLHVYSMDEITWKKLVKIEGEVNRPGEYPLYDQMTVKDLVFLAGSFTRSASLLRAEVARIDTASQVNIQYIDLGDDSAMATVLDEEDHVYIRRIPQWQLHRTVTITGEVNYPGEYMMSNRQETLYDLLTRSGGFTESAFPRGTIFRRKSIGDVINRSGIQSVLAKSSPMTQDSTGKITRTVHFDIEPAALSRMVIDMDKIEASRGQFGNIVLEPGDSIHVPSLPSGITVMGAVGANGTIKYLEDQNVKYYVNRAGNFALQADKKQTRLIKANGLVYSGGGVLGKHVDLGDIIVVPTKVEKDHDWTKSLTAILGITTSALTTALLITKL